MQSVTNPIYKYSPEKFFPAQPVLDVAIAVRQDNVVALDRLFAQHPELNLNQVGQQGVTLLFWAFAHQNINAIKWLSAHGADVNRPMALLNEKGGLDITHLINIAAKGSKDVLMVVLLDLGADPNAVDERKVPVLQNALYDNNFKLMKLLLNRGADVDTPDSSGATAAVVLSRLNNFEMVYYLLERGADWHSTDGAVALNTQEIDIGNERSLAWQIKVKHLLMTKGVKFPVPSSGAKRYASIRQRWQQTPEGHAWRLKLDALGAQPNIVGKIWTKEENIARAAMKTWMQQQGISEPPLFSPTAK